MQFSSAKATVRNHLIGGTANNSIEDYHATDLGELSLAAFEKSRGTRGPVSVVEQALAELPTELGRDEQRKSMGCVRVCGCGCGCLCVCVCVCVCCAFLLPFLVPLFFDSQMGAYTNS